MPGTPAGVTSTNPGLALGGQKPAAYYAPSGADSYVVGRGTNVGFPYLGSAPDIGAYEYQSATNPIGIVSGSVYELEPQCAPGKRLDVAGAKTTNGTNVQIWQQNGSAAQAWRLEAVGSGYYELIPQCASDKRLDVSGMSSSNGANLHLWQDYSNAAQRWKFILKSSNARTVSKKTKKGTEEAPVEQLQAYPNPVKDQLQIAVPTSELATQLRIHDLLGRLWLEKVLPESQSVDVSRLPPGVYTLHLQQGAVVQTLKLAIE